MPEPPTPDHRPGLRDRSRSWVRSIRPERRHFRADALAGIPGAVSGVPDGMATAVLAGVNPVYGLYATFAGPIAGGLSSSTRLMVITTTSAAALAAGSVLESIEPTQRADALFLLTVMAGVAMVIAGVLRLGRYTRFVSYSVMLGFLTGVAINIIASQLAHLTGVVAEGAVPLAKAVDVVTHPGRIDVSSLLAGLSALTILFLLARTRLAVVSALVALVVPTVVVLAAGLDTVAQVTDVGAIPTGVPLPHLPDLGALSFGLVTGALAVAAIVLVQGAGVSESAPNPDGSRADANRNFIAQGIGNLASGLFRGLPVGGSVGQTALNVRSGARTRWAAIWIGIWMLLILVVFSGVVGQVVMPTLAAILIFAALGALRPAEIATMWRTGATSQVAMVTTFLATLSLPVAAAVGLGVALSLILQLNQEALDLAVVELVPREDGRFVERPAPRTLRSGEAVVLDVYGSLFYAGARTLQAKLPDPAGSTSPAVVLRLRGRTTLGATFLDVVTDYARRLDAVGGRLYLSGLAPEITGRLHRTGRLEPTGPVRLFDAQDLVGESTREAYRDAEAWLVVHLPDAESDG